MKLRLNLRATLVSTAATLVSTAAKLVSTAAKLVSTAAKLVAASLLAAAATVASAADPASPPTPAARMAATVIRQWPAGATSPQGEAKWAYEEGTLLDGLTAQWRASGDGADFAYVQAAVERLVTPQGAILGYKPEGHTLDDIEMGRAALMLYRVTQDPRYAKAAQFLEDQLALQPRTASGGYWHKQIYPNQMWLDGAYMAEPFRAAFAATFARTADFDDIAHQLLLMEEHMRDPRTGLLRHGWDESRQMPWADKTTGLSPEAWGRAMGWYVMALVDVLDWFPPDHPQRPALVAALNRNVAALLKVQDSESGLWWQVLDHPAKHGPMVARQPDGSIRVGIARAADGNYLEASASCMFTYAIAKGVRRGYLPPADMTHARRAWQGIQSHFVTTQPDGSAVLHGTVKVGGLGGKPYRSGDFSYYIHEPIVDNDAKGIGAYLLAGSELDYDPRQPASNSPAASLPSSKAFRDPDETPQHTRRPLVLVDAWFNSQTRTTALGNVELYHYKWTDDSNSGYSVFGRAFLRRRADLADLPSAPTAATLARAQVYVIASPDIPATNPAPHYMDAPSASAIEAWVRAGGVLLLFSNDPAHAEFTHFNNLADRFGLHFNPVLSHHVVEPDHSAGEVSIPSGTGIFQQSFTAYMKDTCTLSVSGPARSLVTSDGAVMIAVSHLGRGTVLAVVDPWVYNEYADGRKLPQYHGFQAADDLAAWALRQTH